jgi:DNA-directed RNA polymerase subunit RPC12/RpoP
MPLYFCHQCDESVEIPQIARGASAPCPNCGTAITHKRRLPDANQYDGMSFVAKRPRVGGAAAQVAVIPLVTPGRSAAAPVRTAWPGQMLSGHVTYVPNLTDRLWTGAGTDTIRLAYRDLTPGSGRLEGLLITCPEMSQSRSLQLHYDTVRIQLVTATRPPAIAEATGEAAAALCILRRNSFTRGATQLQLAGFEMVWGMHVHSGAGIDQIWRRNNEFLIVEAKGPHQVLSPNLFMPPQFEQMGLRWVMHNLETMSRNGHVIATDILSALGVTTGVRWPNYQGSSKNYYGVTAIARPAVGRLFGVVVTAVWQPDGMLGYSPYLFREYTNFAA